ncbi:coiled-coil domain-containing protein 177-like isoform X2 [Rhopilema esculentum]|uniref:coiled-coil domain-containing protein 177-like isoform X2 n=1 Tax=Rhopilema esculentum TaxID=499914 RepID=UPI0031D54503
MFPWIPGMKGLSRLVLVAGLILKTRQKKLLEQQPAKFEKQKVLGHIWLPDRNITKIFLRYQVYFSFVLAVVYPMMIGNQVPNINLFNFEEPFAENSKYVLTSPRSLKACEIVGIKPVELLHKPLSEFEDEYNGRLGPDMILDRYQRREQQRLRMLRYCREERSRIVDEKEETEKSSAKQKRTGELTDFLDTSDNENTEFMETRQRKRTSKDPSARWSLMLDSPKDRDRVERSLSIRYSKGDETRSPRDERPSSQMSGFLGRVYGVESSGYSPGVESWKSSTEPRPYASKETATRRHGWDERYNQMKSRSIERSPASKKKGHKMQRTLSVDNILSDLPPHLQKGAAKLSESDQRLLNIMVTKANKEDEDKRLRAERKLELAEQRQVEAELKHLKMKQHQMLLADKMRESERLRNNELLLKKMQKEERKAIQEQNLARIAEEKDYLRSMTHMGLEGRHVTAAKNKDMQIRLAKSKQFFKNMEEQQRHERTMEETKRRLLEDQKALQYAIEAKQRQAESNTRAKESQQDFQRSLHKMKSQARKEQQEESLKRMHDDLGVWQKELKRYQLQHEERALETAKHNAYLKGKKAMMERLQKEHDHLTNKAKIKEDEKLRLAELQHYLQQKDEKSKLVIEDRKEMARSNREAALASRTMRDFIKEKTIKSSFDKMATEAEMMARIEKKGFRSSAKNITTMKLA